jgi:5-methylcytosine-specific restriction endonuclease McrA
MNAGVWNYDHKNGDRSNNKITNCQALCPNCHAKKTRGLLKSKVKSSKKLLKLFIISLIILIAILFFY